jgi:hypothetical protein
MLFRRASRLFAAFSLAALVSLPVSAALCPGCKGKSHTKDIGSCKLCEESTMSGEFQLCMDCSDRLQECEQCRKELAPAAPKIDDKQDGVHKWGRWTYEFSIANPGSRSEGYHGKLSLAGKPFPEPEAINDVARTPWGPIYWVGNPVVAFGGHGWMLKPLPSKPVGQRLIPPGGPVTVRLKVMAPDYGQTPEEPWIREMMKEMQIPRGVGAAMTWITLGKAPVTIHDSKHFGQVYIAVADPGPQAPLQLVITGSHPATIELSRQPGTHRIVPHGIASSVASLDFFFAIEVTAK